MKWRGTAIRAIAGLGVATCGVYFFYPMLSNSGPVLPPRGFSNWQEQRDYYSALTAVFGFVSATAGLGLGYLYYSERRRALDRWNVQVRRSEYLREYLRVMSDAHASIRVLLRRDPRDGQELHQARHAVSTQLESLQVMLNVGDKLLNLDSDEIKLSIEVWRVIDTSDAMMRVSYDEYVASNLGQMEQSYTVAYERALRSCWSALAKPLELYS